MAWEARSGWKLFVVYVTEPQSRGLNGLGSPVGMETLKPARVRRRE